MSSRLVGAALVLLACLFFAGRLSAERRRALDALRSVDAALERLYAELSLRATGLPELTKLLAEECSGAARRFFHSLDTLMGLLGERPFSELWRVAARAVPELGDEERAALLRLGGALGRYALDDQLAAVADCRARLRRAADERALKLAEQRRLAYGLSLAAGGLVCILLF